jgi:hypothetical protein
VRREAASALYNQVNDGPHTKMINAALCSRSVLQQCLCVVYIRCVCAVLAWVLLMCVWSEGSAVYDVFADFFVLFPGDPHVLE